MFESISAFARSVFSTQGGEGKGKRSWLPLFLLLLLAVVFLSLSACLGERGDNLLCSEEAEALYAFRTQEEARLSELICHLDGVDKCYVSLHFSRGEESVYEGGVMVSFSPACVSSAVVVCEGRLSPALKETIVDMVTTLYGIGSNRVSVSHTNSVK